ncbi:MAG: chromate efflux transporter [Brevundimonas sp.]|jgi:chromate transporter|uniref:chromate efflux transporter n=1 Tax=Brevundimonas sp. TaxID=1871086 RepID=UPI00391D6DA3
MADARDPDQPCSETGASGLRRVRLFEVLMVFTRLGLTSFGGPIAHIGYFHEALVRRRRWVSEARFAALIALSNLLPGPSSSQVVQALGAARAGGNLGALAAFVAFTWPSALIMLALALGVERVGALTDQPWVMALKAAALGVVIHAAITMARASVRGRLELVIVLASSGAALMPGGMGYAAGIVLVAAALGFLRGAGPDAAPQPEPAADPAPGPAVARGSRRAAAFCLGLFLSLLVMLPLGARLTGDPTLQMLDAFYRAGALVIGGGHVLLPLLEGEVVARGFIDRDTFLAGYGAAQALPGPLFAFAAYVGALSQVGPGGVLGGLLALGAVFLPGALLMSAAAPFLDHAMAAPRLARAVRAGSAAAVGLVIAVIVGTLMPALGGSVGAWLIAGATLAGLMSGRVPVLVLLALAVGAGLVAL